MNEGKRAVIYTRISRDDTGSGIANDRQEADCRKLAELRRWDVIAVEADVSVSASSGVVRPAWERVLGMIERGEVDVVIAYHFDRVARSMLDLERMILLTEAQGVGISTVVGDIDLTTDMGRMVARILAAVARQEVERKARRQKDANRQRAEQGIPWRTGFRAFGYEMDGAVREDEAALIRSASEDALNGKALKAIAREWNEAGIHTARQRVNMDGWSHRSVKSVLLNPRNAGIATYRGEVIGKGQWSSIIDETTHALLVAKLTDPSRTRGTVKAGRKASNLLTGIAICGTCGEPVQAGSSKQGPMYQCKSYHVSTHRADAESYISEGIALAARTMLPGMVLSIPSRGQSAERLREVERKRADLEELGQAYASMHPITFKAAEAALSRELEALEAALEESIGGEGEYDATALNEAAIGHFDRLGLDGKRSALERLCRIRLYPKGRGNKRGLVPIAEQVELDVKVTDRDGLVEWVPVLRRPDHAAELPARAVKRPSDVLTSTSKGLSR